MKRIAKITSLVASGFLVGATTGYIAATRDDDTTVPERNPETLNMSLPKDFFATLPKSDDGKHRLVAVETFTFSGPDNDFMNAGDELVLPRLEIASVPNSDQ